MCTRPHPDIYPSMCYRGKQEGNRVDTMGGRRDGEGDKEKDAKQRRAASRAEMPSQMKSKGSVHVGEKMRESVFKRERVLEEVTNTAAHTQALSTR